jgi:hypothetical protein
MTKLLLQPEQRVLAVIRTAKILSDPWVKTQGIRSQIGVIRRFKSSMDYDDWSGIYKNPAKD